MLQLQFETTVQMCPCGHQKMQQYIGQLKLKRHLNSLWNLEMKTNELSYYISEVTSMSCNNYTYTFK